MKLLKLLYNRSCFLLFLIPINVALGQNLVVNSGFEDINVCCEKKAPCSPEGWFGLEIHRYDHDIIPLNPDYKNKANGRAAIWIETGSPIFRNGWSKFGAVTPLIKPLLPNHTYIIKLKVKAHVYAINEFHATFCDSALPIIKKQKPAITFKHKRFIKGKKWVEVMQTYTASGTEKFLILGLLKPCNQIRYKSIDGNKGLGGIYIDDVEIIPTDSMEKQVVLAATDSAQLHIYNENRRHDFQRLCRGSNILFPTLMIDHIIDSTTTMRDILSEERLVAFNADMNRGAYLTNLTYNESYQLTPQANHIINPILDQLKANKQSEIILVGHVDVRMSDFENHSISVLHAMAVKNYLIKNGIAKIRIRVDGKGSSDNIGNIAHPKGYNLNNRIEYIITPTPINKN